MINIAVTLHLNAGRETYLKALAALYASIRSHTQDALHFFIIHDETLNAGQKAKLSAYIQHHHNNISFIDITQHPHIAQTGHQYGLAPYSPAVIWRIYLAELLPVDKIILLDADLIFLFDIAKIWHQAMDDYAISASLRRKPWDPLYHQVIQTPPERYFRIGVSLLNLKEIRQNTLFSQQRAPFLENILPQVKHINYLPEQSLYNYFFNKHCLPLEISLIREPAPNAPQALKEERLKRLREENHIILDVKGWRNTSAFAAFYWGYLLMTPWGEG